MKIDILKVNAFTDKIDGGNPAGIVFDSPDLTDKQMTNISKTLKVSETAFLFPSDNADFKTRFFSPEMEVDLCGHATIATFFTMGLKDYFPKNKSIVVTQETKAGILPVEIVFSDDGNVKRVMMTQAKSELRDIYLDISELADSLKIAPVEIDDSLPAQAVSSGLFTLPICIKSFNTLKSITPDFKKITEICKKHDLGSFHLFTFETLELNSVYHARNFAPLYAVNEDPVTGTANGAVCSYLLKNKIRTCENWVCEQGDIMGRSGRVFVNIKNDVVKVGGIAKIVDEIKIEI